MSRLEIIMTLILAISIALNIGLVTYARAVLARLLFVSEELRDLQDMINNFSTHLSDVYSLEMFYGDQTLESLMEHAVSFNEQLETFEEIYSLTTEETKEADFENDPDNDDQESD